MLTRDLNQLNLGRIVPPPAAGSDTSPTYVNPRLYIVGAGQTGLAANQADKNARVALSRSNQSNTGSPNAQVAVGSNGTPGLDGAPVAKMLQIVQPTSAITGANGQTVSPTIVRKPRWLKPALFIAGGFILGALVFK